MTKISQRGRMAPFLVMDTLAKANEMERQGRKVFRFEAGQPAFPVPARAAEAGAKFATQSLVEYTTPMGMPALRHAIRTHYQFVYGVDININRIVITPGASGAFSLAFLSCFEAGDRVAMAMPCYPSYKRILESFGVQVVPLMATEADKYQPTPALLADALRNGPLDGLVVASPNNPTGTMLRADEMDDLVAYCAKHNIRVVSDELYHGIEFCDDNTPRTACQIDENALVINSFSKYFCMTGWRLGWLIVPDTMISVINNLQSNLFICASAVSQAVGLEVFECRDILESRVHMYRKNRDFFVQRLTDMGIDKFAYPEGGFYLYVDIGHLTDNSLRFCQDVLNQAGVSISSGLDFDTTRGHTTVRFSYVCDYEHAVEGLQAFENYINTL